MATKKPPATATETPAPEKPTMNFENILAALKEPVDPAKIKQREGWKDRSGNVHMVDYVEWHTTANLLDQFAPEWAWRVRELREVGDLMVCVGEITIEGVTRQGVGTGVVSTEMGIKKAEHDALKRAAVKFGVGRELYMKEASLEEQYGGSDNYQNGGGGRQIPSDPVAKSLTELVSGKQLGMIRAVARNLHIEPEEECASFWMEHAGSGCGLEEMSKKAASAFIDHLKEMEELGVNNIRERAALGTNKASEAGSTPTHTGEPAQTARQATGAAVKASQARQQANPPPAGQPALGTSVEMRTVNVIRMALNKANANEGEWVKWASNERTSDLKSLSQDEADRLLEELEAQSRA